MENKNVFFFFTKSHIVFSETIHSKSNKGKQILPLVHTQVNANTYSEKKCILKESVEEIASGQIN